MHSSRMRTVCCSGHLKRWGVYPGRGCLPRGCVCKGAGGVCPGVGVSAQEGVCLGGWCLPRGGVCLEGVVVSSLLGYLPRGVVYTYTDTCNNITFPQLLLRMVIIMCQISGSGFISTLCKITKGRGTL